MKKKFTFQTILVLLFLLIGTVTKAEKIDNIKISINYKNTEAKTILNDITNQSGYNFVYKSSDINDLKKLSLKLNNATVRKVAEIIARSLNASFDYTESEIIFKKKITGNKKINLTGKVLDENGETLPGVNVVIKNTVIGTLTDVDGNFDLTVGAEHLGKDLSIKSIGYKEVLQQIEGDKKYSVQLEQESVDVDEVVVVAFGKQKKESVLASVETVNVADLKVPSSNLTTALQGRMSGLISYQRSGEPGQDNAEFFVRGVTTFGYKTDPLILIDGIELSTSDLSRLNTDDIATFSIMKDATATALYGARGANGVILVTTKEGKEGPAKVSVRYEKAISMSTQDVNIADPVSYMKLYNEAVKTRNPLAPLRYRAADIQNTILGTNPYAYPAVDWHDMLFKDYTDNTRFNVNVNGGGKVAQYYVAFSANTDNGILKVDDRNNFNNNIEINKYLLRSNVNINLTSNTKMKVRMHGTFDDYTGPLDGGSTVYNKVMRTSPVDFPAYFEPDEANKYTKHIMFGGSDASVNPYADMVKGYKENTRSLLLAQLELEHNFDWLVEGLTLRTLANTTRKSFFEASRAYKPFYYTSLYDIATRDYFLAPLNPDSGQEHLDYKEGSKTVDNTLYFETALLYNTTIAEVHDMTSMLVYTMRESIKSGEDDFQKALPYRNMGLSGRFTYAYDSKYFGEFNFGYNGSERFDENNRFGFFPSAGLAWFVSNEEFFDGIKSVVNKLKLKATYGLVGNDAIGGSEDRFFYLSNVNLNEGDRRSKFGYDNEWSRDGVKVKRYGNPNITWEESKKLNIGIELGLFNSLELMVDIFTEHRSNILMDRTIPYELGFTADLRANVGEAQSKGVDLSLDYQKFITNDFWITATSNFTFATSEFTKYEEPDYSNTPWLSKVGKSLKQKWGLVAERLFIDQYEIDNSPRQFGEYLAGDIKYKDVNGDGKITDLDKVPIGHPTTPEITYGFGLSVGYKGFDVSCFFSGNARTSFWLDTEKTSPFVDLDLGNGVKWDDDKITRTTLLQAYNEDHWSEKNRNAYATWPRLSPSLVENNNRTSTWFMQDGSFLRLKQLEVGYKLPESVIKPFKLTKFRIYLSATNLAVWSSFKLWDPEMGGNGLGYPIQRQISAGININF
jgi:TonB-linked SusC/RagA family outer membrane protein